MNTRAFLDSIKDKHVTLSIIGLGYVGLPLALNFSESGFSVLGFDTDKKKVEQLINGQSYINYIPDQKISKAVSAGLFKPVSNFGELKNTNIIIICVPTPINKNREPDLGFVRSTAEEIASILRSGQLIILESTTYPGCTETILKPILETSGLTSRIDFYLSYSPERVDPGNRDFKNEDIPKVVGGDGEDALKLATNLYGQIFNQIVPVSSMDAAEATKLAENIFRSVNIALVNELKIIFSKMGVDVWEVIEAAKTKPFGFMPFYPGPGLGGHCIPVDPFYLSWRAKELGEVSEFIELSGKINTGMPERVVSALVFGLENKLKKRVDESKILILGLAYKKNVDDTRESPSFVIIKSLEQRGAVVEYFDDYVPVIPKTRDHSDLEGRKSITWDLKSLSTYDAVLICTDHDNLPYSDIALNAKLVVDTRNVMGRLGINSKNIIKA